MTRLTKILLENVRSALMVPCDEDSSDVAMQVHIISRSGERLVLTGEKAADVWKALGGKHDKV